MESWKVLACCHFCKDEVEHVDDDVCHVRSHMAVVIVFHLNQSYVSVNPRVLSHFHGKLVHLSIERIKFVIFPVHCQMCLAKTTSLAMV